LFSDKSTPKAYVGRPRHPTQEKSKVKIATQFFQIIIAALFAPPSFSFQKLNRKSAGLKSLASARVKT